MIIGWYKMEGPAGTKLPEEIIADQHCGTYATGWLNGDHPTTLNEIVDREVCFSYQNGSQNPCPRKTQIQIINCGDFYLYNLDDTPLCFLRYCSE